MRALENKSDSKTDFCEDLESIPAPSQSQGKRDYCVVETLILYSKPGCHLCELAETVFHAHRSSGRFKLEITNIAKSNELMKRYGIRIPVIRDPVTGKEIGWPFNDQQLSKFLNSLS